MIELVKRFVCLNDKGEVIGYFNSPQSDPNIIGYAEIVESKEISKKIDLFLQDNIVELPQTIKEKI